MNVHTLSFSWALLGSDQCCACDYGQDEKVKAYPPPGAFVPRFKSSTDHVPAPAGNSHEYLARYSRVALAVTVVLSQTNGTSTVMRLEVVRRYPWPNPTHAQVAVASPC